MWDGWFVVAAIRRINKSWLASCVEGRLGKGGDKREIDREKVGVVVGDR